MNVDPAQGRGVDAMTKLLGTDIAHQMGRGIGVTVGVTLETHHPPDWAVRCVGLRFG